MMRESLRDWLLFPKSWSKLASILVLPLLVVLILLIVTLFNWEKKSLDEIQISGLREVGRAFFGHLMATRIWTRGHGGIYVEVPELAPAGPTSRDPALEGVSILGKNYKKIHPNMITAQILEIINRTGGYKFHITSLQPANPQNRPDPWEESVLRGFEQGQKEATTIAEMGGSRLFRYMAPLTLAESCLTCHQWGGYKVSDLRGGISIDIPMGYSDSLYAQQTKRTATSFGALGVITITFLIGIVWFFSRRISEGFNITLRQQEALHRLNTRLTEISARDKKILENMGDALAVIDTYGRIEAANRVFLMALEMSPENLIGRRVDEFPADGLAGRILEPYRRGGAGEEPLPAGEMAIAYRRDRIGEPEEIRIGERAFTASSIFVMDEGGEDFFCELRILHDATKEKLQAAMELSAAAAHEIRQPLAILLGLKDILLDRLGAAGAPAEELAALEEQVSRVNAIIERMLNLTTYRTRSYAEGMRIFDLGTGSVEREGGQGTNE